MGPKLPRETAARNAARRRAALDLVQEAIREKAATGEEILWPLDGDSMRPLLQPEDQLIIHPVDAASIRVGQMVLFEARGQLVCHRLIRAEPLELVGDANQRLDRIGPEALLGRVTAVERNGRRLRLDSGLLNAAGPALAIWHRLGRRLLLSHAVLKPVGILLEGLRMLTLRLLALRWSRVALTPQPPLPKPGEGEPEA